LSWLKHDIINDTYFRAENKVSVKNVQIKLGRI